MTRDESSRALLMAGVAFRAASSAMFLGNLAGQTYAGHTCTCTLSSEEDEHKADYGGLFGDSRVCCDRRRPHGLSQTATTYVHIQVLVQTVCSPPSPPQPSPAAPRLGCVALDTAVRFTIYCLLLFDRYCCSPR